MCHAYVMTIFMNVAILGYYKVLWNHSNPILHKYP